MGNLALPCYIMAKKMHKNPLQIASELAEKLNEQKDELGIEKAENVGVYCNIYLKRDLIVKKCFEVLEKDKHGVSQIGIGKTVCIVTRYVIALATAFNKFYHDCTILQADEKEKIARLLLTDLVQKILCEACGVLGMECPDEM